MQKYIFFSSIMRLFGENLFPLHRKIIKQFLFINLKTKIMSEVAAKVKAIIVDKLELKKQICFPNSKFYQRPGC